MNRKIAVERSLTPVRDLLSSKGYTVDSINMNNEFTKEMQKYDAIVVTGMNEDFLGIQDRNTKALVINAEGLTAEQIYGEIENRLH